LYTKRGNKFKGVLSLKSKKFISEQGNGGIQYITSIRNDEYVLAASMIAIDLFDKKGKKISSLKLDHSITSVAVNSQANRILVGAIGKAFVYELNDGWWRKSNKRKAFNPRPLATISFADRQKELAISSVGVNDQGLVVFGSEVGDLWILPKIPESDLFFEDCPYHYNKQISTITSVAFNTTGEQMASSSLDGTVILWNLTTLEDDDEQIQLRENGHGIWTICYKNDLELVVAENIFLNIWFSQAESLKESLERRAKERQANGLESE